MKTAQKIYSRLFAGIGLVALLLLNLISYAQQKNLKLYQIDPLEKVLKERNYFLDRPDTMRAAAGETISIQIVVKANKEVQQLDASLGTISNGKEILTGHTGWLGYVKVGRRYNEPSKDLINSVSGYFPDPILTDTTMQLETGEVQPLWITVPVPVEAKPGIYTGSVKISGRFNKKKESFLKDFVIQVYPVKVPKTSLLVSNWSSHESPMSLAHLNKGIRVEYYTPLYWELIKIQAEIMASHGQNVFYTFPVWRTHYTLKDGKYTFDFSNYDKEVEIFERTGALERIEGAHLAIRGGAWEGPFYVTIPVEASEENKINANALSLDGINKELRMVNLPLSDSRTKNFLDQFLPAFKKHLEGKGWLNKYMQHIGDEPLPSNADSYLEISDYVRKYLPGVKIMDAVLTSKELRENGIDTWIPVLDIMHTDYKFYQDLQKKGKEIWFYTCLRPRGNYANRFIELPLLQTRYLHWINFKYNIPGYLHWGLNFWGATDPLTEELTRDNSNLPAGDNNIIYPGYHKVYSSIRFEAMRDGIYDNELLRMLDKKNKAKAWEFVNTIIHDFDKYDGSISYFRKIRKNILEELSK